MKGLQKEYTQEELFLIKAILFKAFGDEYIPVDLHLKDLNSKYSKTNGIKFKKGQNYYQYSPVDEEEWGGKKGWHTIYITYVRSGVVFYTVDNNRKEFNFTEDSIFAMSLIPQTLHLKLVGIHDMNVPLLKFNKGTCPHEIVVVKNNGETFNV